jgi:hypothetical protein
MSRLKTVQPKQLLAVALILVAAGALAFALRDIVREAVVMPLAYAAWFADLLLKSVPQALLLAVLLILGIYIALRGFAQRIESSALPPPGPTKSAPRSRLSFWIRQLGNLESSALAREKTADEIRGLILNILTYEEGADEEEIVQRVRDGALVVPPEVKSLLLNGQRWMNPEPRRSFPRVWRRWLDLRRPAGRTATQLSRMDGKLEAVIDFLEVHVGGSSPQASTSGRPPID